MTEAEALKRYGGKLNPGSNVAFGGYKRGQGSGQLYVDVLKDGTIKQYVLEVDKATGQVKEYVAAENALAKSKKGRRALILKHTAACGRIRSASYWRLCTHRRSPA